MCLAGTYREASGSKDQPGDREFGVPIAGHGRDQDQPLRVVLQRKGSVAIADFVEPAGDDSSQNDADMVPAAGKHLSVLLAGGGDAAIELLLG
jgi:hypothetical protein